MNLQTLKAADLPDPHSFLKDFFKNFFATTGDDTLKGDGQYFLMVVFLLAGVCCAIWGLSDWLPGVLLFGFLGIAAGVVCYSSVSSCS
jgi:hypothetical protein